MPEYCHRCGGALPEGSGESPFCPHCGTPQLFLALENQSVETGGEPAPGTDSADTTGAVPPPRPGQVEWKTAIRCAAGVAIVGALLSLIAVPVAPLSTLSFLWIMSASLITVGLYRKRRPAAWIDVRVGARIGLVVGICLALGLGAAMAAAGLVERYGMHAMGNFDSEMTAQLQKAIQQSATPVPAEMMGFLRSPEFRAGMMLVGFGFVSACLLVMSLVFGAFAGLLRTRRAPVL